MSHKKIDYVATRSIVLGVETHVRSVQMEAMQILRGARPSRRSKDQKVLIERGDYRRKRCRAPLSVRIVEVTDKTVAHTSVSCDRPMRVGTRQFVESPLEIGCGRTKVAADILVNEEYVFIRTGAKTGDHLEWVRVPVAQALVSGDRLSEPGNLERRTHLSVLRLIVDEGCEPKRRHALILT